MTVYTLGDWQVKSGQAEQFAAQWHALTESSLAEVEPDARVVLLRDTERPGHYYSIGEFCNDEAIVRLRDGCVLGAKVSGLADLLEHGSTTVLSVVDVIGDVSLRTAAIP